MNKNWMPITAGLIEIVHGAGGIFVVLLVILVSQTLRDFFGSPDWYSYLLMLAVVIAGILSIIGGIKALKRKNWPVALAGSIASLALTAWSLEYWISIERYGFGINTLYGFAWVPAMFAIILTVISRRQFAK